MTAFVILGKLISGCFKTLFKDVLIPLKKSVGGFTSFSIPYNIDFKNHTSDDRISYEELSDIFNNISNHLVIAVKGFYRRANLIPNEWKKKIGATHERYVKKYDTNVQVQGLPGRMSGYWKQELLNGHKTGPHRTSIDAINEYEEFYKNPFGKKNIAQQVQKNYL